MSAQPDSPPRCARCGQYFECGMLAGAERCWCAELPPLDPVPGETCLCPACLRAALAAAPGARHS
ncbi:MAG: cysteine-rich CWC family protein [Burkholderiales bacterium]